MTSIFDPLMPIFLPALGLCALMMLIVGTWYFVTGRRKELALSSEELERISVTDPGLSPARALYTSGMIYARIQDKSSGGKWSGDNGSSSDGGGD